MTDFWRRLKQRKLVQWSIAYVAFAFALLQGLDVVAHQFGWPDGLQRGITLVLIFGFFLAVVLAWYHGERGAQKVSGTEIVILALLLAIGGGLLWRFERAVPSGNAQSSSPDAAQHNPGKAAPDFVAGATSSGLQNAAHDSTLGSSPAEPAIAIPAKSVAVLPFVNMSGDPKNDYFSDGITEEILDALAQVPKLKVAARTSAFAFKGKAEDLRKVGKVLDVATVLEGSVQQSGDEVRITAQLIDTRSGYHLWSEKYDRKLTSIFAVEDEISNHPDEVFVHRSALWVYLAFHRYSEAERQARVASKLNGEDQDASGLLIRGIADPPMRERAIRVLDTSSAMSGIRKDAFVHASFLLLLGERERALVALAGFVPNGESNTVQFVWNPAFDPIRNDPRFKAVLKKMGLPYIPTTGAAQSPTSGNA